MAEKEKKIKWDDGADNVDLAHLDTSLLERLKTAEFAASDTNDNMVASRGSARLRQADNDVAKRNEVGASTYSLGAIASIEEALGLGMIGVSEGALLAQMGQEIERGELDPTSLPLSIRKHLGV